MLMTSRRGPEPEVNVPLVREAPDVAYDGLAAGNRRLDGAPRVRLHSQRGLDETGPFQCRPVGAAGLTNVLRFVVRFA
jgi:hypothetical protein